MEEVNETFETIEEQYSKLKYVLQNDRDGLFKNTDLNEAQVLFRVLDQKLNFVMDVSNLDPERMGRVQAIMLHISTEEAKFFARCGNELKGANILLDAIRATAVRSGEFPLICLRAANVCAALLIHHDCSGSVETAASVVRRAVEDYKAAEESGLSTCKLNGEQLLHTLSGRQLKDGDTERDCRDAVSTALLLLAVGHGRMACEVLHQPFLQHALSVQLLWPSEHLDRRRWTIAALSLAACFIDSCRLRAARRYLCAAGYMLQQEINSKNNALPDVNWFKSIQTLLRHLFELIVGYALGVFRTSRPYWDSSPDKSPEQSPRSRDLAFESSTAEETDTEFTEAPGSAQFEDDDESLDLGAKLGKLVQEADRRLVDKFRKTITPAYSPFDEFTNVTDSTQSTCLIDVSKDAVDIDEFAITEMNACSGDKPRSLDVRDSISAFCEAPDQMVATNEPIDIDDFAIHTREVDDENSDYSEINETAISTPPDPLECTAGSIDQTGAVSEKGLSETTCRGNLPSLKDDTSDEDHEVDLKIQGSSLRIFCEQKECVDANGGAMEVSEEAERSSIRSNSRLAVCGTEKQEQPEAAPAEEEQQSLLRSGAGDCECSVQLWSPAMPFGREDTTTPLEDAATAPEAPHPVTTQTDADAATAVESGQVGCTEAELQYSEPTTAMEDARENEEIEPIEVNFTDDCRQEVIGGRGSGEGSQQPEDGDDDVAGDFADDDDDQWEDLSSEASDSEDEATWCAPSTAGGDGASTEDGLDLLEMGEWEAAIPPPPVRSPSDAAVLLEAGCCWLERYKTAVEGRFHKQLLLNIAELMRHAARFLPYGRIRKRLLRAAVRRLHAARGLCDGSGDATERRVLCGLSQALLELRLPAEGAGGASQLHAAAEALSRLSAALHDHSNSQLLLQLHIVRHVLDAPFGS